MRGVHARVVNPDKLLRVPNPFKVSFPLVHGWPTLCLRMFGRDTIDTLRHFDQILIVFDYFRAIFSMNTVCKLYCVSDLEFDPFKFDETIGFFS